MNKIYIYLAMYREPMYNIKRNQKGGAVNMEEKIWQIVLAILTAVLTAAAEEIRERLKNKKPKK